jgi:hypothetical protein
LVQHQHHRLVQHQLLPLVQHQHQALARHSLGPLLHLHLERLHPAFLPQPVLRKAHQHLEGLEVHLQVMVLGPLPLDPVQLPHPLEHLPLGRLQLHHLLVQPLGQQLLDFLVLVLTREERRVGGGCVLHVLGQGGEGKAMIHPGSRASFVLLQVHSK